MINVTARFKVKRNLEKQLIETFGFEDLRKESFVEHDWTENPHKLVLYYYNNNHVGTWNIGKRAGWIY